MGHWSTVKMGPAAGPDTWEKAEPQMNEMDADEEE